MILKKKLFKTGKIALSASVVAGAAVQSGIMDLLTVNANTIVVNSDATNPQDGKTYYVYKIFDSQGNAEDGITYHIAGATAEDKKTNLAKLQNAIKKTADKAGITVSNGEIDSEAKVVEWIQEHITESKPSGMTDSFGNKGVETDAAFDGTATPQGLYRFFLESLEDEDGWNETGTFPMVKKHEVPQADSQAARQTQKVEISDPAIKDGYFVVAEKNEDGQVNQGTSLLMAMQISDEENITVNLKSDYPDVIKKVKEDDGELGWNDIGDYEIGQDIDYEYISEVPNMTAYKTYSFAFNDTLDEALELDPTSVKVKVGAKEYDVKYTKGANTTNPSSPWELKMGEGGKFDVECKDLKALETSEASTKEIPNPDYKSAEETPDVPETITENVPASVAAAGDQIKVTYKARLKDPDKLVGRASAFENKVKITYSNNPKSGHEGERGESPEDTVVVYTYGLDLRKVNDKHDKLAGAEFEMKRSDNSQVWFKDNGDGTYTVDKSINAATEGYTKTIATQGADGKLIIYGLDAETYTLKETKAPDNYTQLYGDITLVVSSAFQDARGANEELAGHVDKEADGYHAGTGGSADVLKTLSATAVYNKDTINDRVDLDAADTAFAHLVDANGEAVAVDGAQDAADGIIAATVVNKKNTPLAFTGGQSLIALTVTLAAGGLYAVARKKRLESEAE